MTAATYGAHIVALKTVIFVGNFAYRERVDDIVIVDSLQQSYSVRRHSTDSSGVQLASFHRRSPSVYREQPRVVRHLLLKAMVPNSWLLFTIRYNSLHVRSTPV